MRRFAVSKKELVGGRELEKLVGGTKLENDRKWYGYACFSKLFEETCQTKINKKCENFYSKNTTKKRRR